MVSLNATDPRKLVARLTTKLALRGFPVTVDDNLKALRVLESVPPDVSPEELGHILAGIYSRTHEQYEDFMKVWCSMYCPQRASEQVSEERVRADIDRASEEIGQRVASRLFRRIDREELVPLSAEEILRFRGWLKFSRANR